MNSKKTKKFTFDHDTNWYGIKRNRDTYDVSGYHFDTRLTL